jgi:hypothetical protein
MKIHILINYQNRFTSVMALECIVHPLLLYK